MGVIRTLKSSMEARGAKSSSVVMVLAILGGLSKLMVLIFLRPNLVLEEGCDMCDAQNIQ